MLARDDAFSPSHSFSSTHPHLAVPERYRDAAVCVTFGAICLLLTAFTLYFGPGGAGSGGDELAMVAAQSEIPLRPPYP